MKQSGVIAVERRSDAGLRRGANSAGPRRPQRGPFPAIAIGRRRGRHAGLAAHADLDRRLSAGFLDGRSVSVLLAKPAPRWLLLAGKYLGVLAFVCFTRCCSSAARGWRSAAAPAFGTRVTCIASRCCCCTLPSSLASRCCWPCYAEHGGVRVWLDRVLVHHLGHELRPACRGHEQPLMPEGISRGPRLAGGCRLLDPAEAGRFRRVAVQRTGCERLFRPDLRSEDADAHGFSIWLSVLTSLAFTGYVLFASGRRFAATDY